MASAVDLRLCAGEHVVYFYDDESDLAVVTAGYLGAALADGGAAIAIATAAHRAALIAELRGLGVDVASAERAGTLVLLDAKATLDRFMADGAPDAGLFRDVVAARIEALSPGRRPVHAFGEMVGLLWDAGDVESVIALEELWNDLLGDVPFSLLCGYPTTVLDGEGADSILKVCDTHSGSCSAIPAPARPEASRTFPAASRSVSRARAFLAETLDSWETRNGVHHDAALVVGELASNAIKHAKSAFTVSLDRGDHGIRVTVGDADPTLPARRAHGVHDTSGRGLSLVDAVAAAWGSTTEPGGKLVWAVIDRAAEETG